MTTTADARLQFSESEVATPRLRRTARRALFWVVIGLVLVLVGVGSLLTIGAQASKARLSATNAGANGAEALISVLRSDGIDTKAPRSLTAATKDAEEDVPNTTLVIYDPTSILDTNQLSALSQDAPNLILIEPTTSELTALAPGVTRAGVSPYVAKADCSYGPVKRAGDVSGLAQAYFASTSGSSAQDCLGQDGAYSLVRVNYSNQTVTVVGTTTAFTNQSIVLSGNAALALGIFGSTTHLVWYLPSFTDSAAITPGTPLPSPPWVFLCFVLLGFVVVAAGIWRGRRLGPIVVERMPVIVRASETLEGRARLYQKASARTHALDALRVGSITRMAALCGLPTIASVDEVIGAIAVVTGRPVPQLRELLLDELPANDSRLVQLSDELLRLEEDVRAAVAPG